MESVGLKEQDALDRPKWKNDIKNIPATPDDGKSPGKSPRRTLRRTLTRLASCRVSRS